MAGLNISPEQIATARQSGYSDQDIVDHLSQKAPDQFKAATDAGYSPTEILDHLGGGTQSAPAAQGNSAPVSATGVAKAVATGLGPDVVSGIGGLPGDARSGVDWLFDKGMGALGLMKPGDSAKIDALQKANSSGIAPPTSSDIRNKLDALGLVHKAQNGVESAAENISSFLPLAAAGPESLAANVVKRGLVPGVTSELAGKATEGTAAEPYARMIGGLVSVGPKAPAPLMTPAGALDAGAQGMNDIRNSGLVLKPGSTEKYASDTLAQLKQMGLDEDLAGTTNKVLGKYADPGGNGNSARVSFTAPDLVALRQKLSNIAQETGPDFKPTQDAKAARVAIDNFDSHLDNLTPMDVAAGDLGQFQNDWREARANYAAGSRAQAIQNVIDKATDRASSESSGLNTGNKLRQALTTAAWNNTTKGFNPAEDAALQKIIDGTMLGNGMRRVSNMLGGGGGIAQGALGLTGLGTMMGGNESMGGAELGAAVLGALMRRGYNASVRSQGNALVQQLLDRAPATATAKALQPAAPLSMSPNMTRLLQLQMARSIAGF